MLAGWDEVVREVVGAPRGLEALAPVGQRPRRGGEIIALVERVAGPEAKDEIVTVGERLIERGLQQGQGAR